MTDRVPPHDLDAERAVLSASMLGASAMDRAAAILKPPQFYSEAHRRIFEACVALHTESQPVDVVQVATRLRDTGRLEQVGGMAYVTEILNAAPAVANVEAYATTVAHKDQLRQLLLTCQRLTAQAYGEVEDVPSFVDAAEQAVYEVARSASVRPRLEPLKAIVVSEYKRWQQADARARADGGSPGITGLPTGLTALDDVLSGLHRGELTVVAGRPGTGKTALVVDIAWHIAALANADGERRHGAALFSLEMPKEQIADRTICSGAEVDLRKSRAGAFTADDWSKLTRSAMGLTKLDQFFINDTPGLTLMQIRTMAREASSDLARVGKQLGVIAVDYLQLMGADRRYDSREQEVSSFSRGLKALAKELQVPVVTLAQLSRKCEERTDKRPMLSDLRESGAIEQDADNVVFIYRDSYYNPDTEDKGVAELIVAKQRNGPAGVTVRVGFRPEWTKFFNLPTQEYGNGV